MTEPNTNPILAALERVEIFTSLDAEQLQDVARHAERVMFRADEIIGAEGAEADGAILIIDGSVERQSASGASSDVTPGSLLAELAMFSEFTFGATFVAKSNVKALRLEREHMLARMNDDPEMAEAFVRVIAGRLKSIATELAALDGHKEERAGVVAA